MDSSLSYMATDDRGCWIVFTAVILAALLLTPRSLQQYGSETLNPTAATTGSKTPAASDDFKTPAGQPSIQQQTKGDNSLAVAGVEGDVNIKVEQRKNAKWKYLCRAAA